MDIDGLLLDPIYNSDLGIEAVLDLGTAGTVTLTVLDKTDGVLLESANSPMVMASSKPAACVRVSELQANSLTRETIKGLPISFSGGTWTIRATQPKSKGRELYLILQDV
jgi:hypothetical protein